MVIKAIVKEETRTPGNANTTVDTTSNIDLRGTWGKDQVTADASLHTHTANMNTTVAMGESPANKVFTGGYLDASVPPHVKTQEANECPVGTKFNPDTGKCEPCTTEENAPTRTIDAPLSGPAKNAAPDRGAQIPKVGALPSSDDNTYWAGKAPVEPSIMQGTRPALESLPSLEERRGRIHAELLAKDSEAKAVAWEQKHNEAYEKLTSLAGQYKGLSEAFDKLNEAKRNTEALLNQQFHNAEVATLQATTKYNEQCALVTDLKNTLNDTRKELDGTSHKYNESMQTNLNLSKKLTTANEEYLTVAKKLENTTEALERAQIQAKKITRISA